MKNRAPIVVNAFAHGGSNILRNLLQSHPELCDAGGETQDAFKGSPVLDGPLTRCARRLLFDVPVRLATGQDIFNPRNLSPRPLPARAVLGFIDSVFFRAKQRARDARTNLYRSPEVRYTTAEIANSRLLLKNTDGLVLTTEIFHTMYPDITFVALLRDGLALCEGKVRQGWSAAEFGAAYRQIVSQILEDAARYQRYAIVRFEDLVARPIEVVHRLYRFAGLASDEVVHYRMQARHVTLSSGKRVLRGGSRVRDLFWCTADQVQAHLLANVDNNQKKKLRPSDRQAFLAAAGDVIGRVERIEGT